MSKPQRSPLVGYNHNITHLAKVFHVQTEDSGPSTPRLFTHLFFGGTILASRKHEYDAAAPDDKVRKLMQDLHKSMIRDLLQARFDDKLVAFFRGRDEPLVVPAGALPEAAMAETPASVLAMSSAPFVRTTSSPSPGMSRSASAATDDGTRGQPSLATGLELPGAEAPLPVGPPRRTTRPIASMSSTERSPSGQAGARSVDMYRARSGRSVSSTTAGKQGNPIARDGVLVERSVVVGGAAPAPQRPPRARASSPPYVVDGEGGDAVPVGAVGSDAIPTGLPDPSASAPSPPASTDNPSGRVVSDAEVVVVPPAGDSPRRERNLDEAILEYLGEDPDS